MDIWFALFVGIIALVAAAGFSLALVGYISVMPASVAGSTRRLWAVLLIPSVIVAVPVAIVYLAAPFTETMPPGVLARWMAIPAVVLHLVALTNFLITHWQEQTKPGKQLLAGLLLLAVAVGGLYGAGPLFAERVMAGVK